MNKCKVKKGNIHYVKGLKSPEILTGKKEKLKENTEVSVYPGKVKISLGNDKYSHTYVLVGYPAVTQAHEGRKYGWFKLEKLKSKKDYIDKECDKLTEECRKDLKKCKKKLKEKKLKKKG